MPFKSEAQRKYLWANEPGIARDWTDKHGSRIAKALGGRIPFYAAGSVDKNEIIEPSSDISNQVALVNDDQKRQMDRDINLIKRGLANLEDAYKNTKIWDDTGSKGFWGVGVREPEPMTLDEFKQEMKDRGYLDIKGTSEQDFDNLQASLEIAGHTASVDNIKTDGTYKSGYITMKDKQLAANKLAANKAAINVFQQGYKAPNIFQRAIGGIKRGINRANEYNRAYNDTTGLNTNYYAGSLHGNIDNAARVGRRNQGRVNNLIGNYIAGKNKMTPLGLRNRINVLGTNKQKQTYLHELGKQTGKNLDGSQWSNPYVNQDLYKDSTEGGIIGTIDPYGNTITRDTINQDVTGMYTPSGSSGMDDIADVTTTESSSAPVDDWSEYTFARGGRIGYAEGGIVNLLPKGAW